MNSLYKRFASLDKYGSFRTIMYVRELTKPTPTMMEPRMRNYTSDVIEVILNRIKDVTRTAIFAMNVKVLREATRVSRFWVL